VKKIHIFKFIYLLFLCTSFLGIASLISSQTAFAKVGQHKEAIVSRSTPLNSDWTMFSFNHSRFNSNEKTLSSANISKLEHAWSTLPTPNTINPAFAELAVANGIVYTTNPNTTPNISLAALNEKTGKVLWQRQLSTDVVKGAPAVANGVVYVSDGVNVDAYNAATGVPIWVVNIQPSSYVVVDSGIVYVQSSLGYPMGQGTVYALDAKTGKKVWSVITQPMLHSSSPTVANGIVYVGGVDGTFFALDARNGKTLWTAFLGTNNAIVTTPVVDNGAVYVEADSYGLFAFNAKTGKQLWFAASDPYVGSPAVAYGMIYFTEDIGIIQAYNETTGKLVWQQQNCDLPSSATVANGVVYVSARNGGVIAFAAKTGKILYTYSNPAQGENVSSPVVANGMVFFNTADGYTNALKLK
jgi:eukaryotic-like serine/threonine-protein kinase